MPAFVADALLAEAAEQLPDAVDLRRRIHRHPELGLELPRTQAAIVDALEGLDFDVRTGNGVSSVVADLRGAKAGPDDPVILLRRHGRVADARGHRPRVRERRRRRDARVRPRRARRDARRCGAVARGAARRASRHRALHVPARRRRLSRRATCSTKACSTRRTSTPRSRSTCRRTCRRDRSGRVAAP